MVIANEANFRAGKGHTTNKLITKMVVETCASIDGNLARNFFSFLHIGIITEVKVGFY